MNDDAPPRRPLGELLDAYDGVLLDVYGVLKDAVGALPGAAALIERLTREHRPWFVVTNDASRSPETLAAVFAGLGLGIPAERVVTSGLLLPAWYAAHRLTGAHTMVLGTADSRRYVEQAGGVVTPIAADAAIDVLCVADDDGFDLLAGLNAALSAVVRRREAGHYVRLVLPNPDLIYPRPDGFGVTAGAVALVLEAAIARRFGPGPGFEPLGKPRPALFDEAARRAGTRRLLMLGDQLETDVAGAIAAGLDVALVETGVSRWPGPPGAPRPTWLLRDLS